MSELRKFSNSDLRSGVVGVCPYLRKVDLTFYRLDI